MLIIEHEDGISMYTHLVVVVVTLGSEGKHVGRNALGIRAPSRMNNTHERVSC